MVVAAVIVSSDSNLSPLTVFGGLSLLKRAVLTAQRAGATTCYLSLGGEPAWLRQELAGDSRITSQVVWDLPDHDSIPKADLDQQWMLYPVDAIFRHPLVLQLTRTKAQEELTVILDSHDLPALILGPGTEVASIGKLLARHNSVPQALENGTRAVQKMAPPQGHFLERLQTVDDAPRLERAMLRSLENSKDGVVDTYLNRKFSRPITRWLLRTPLTPNQITLLACSLGIVGALCFVPGGYWGPVFGALLLQLSTVLDCCDGEVARMKCLESSWGDTLDIVCDTIGSVAIFLGIGAAVWRNCDSAPALLLGGVLAVGGALSFPFVTLAEKTEDAGKQRGGWEDTLIHSLLIGLTTRDYSLLIIASAVAGQLSWFLWGAAVGSHVFWMFLAWLLFRAGRFSLLRTKKKGKEK